MVIKKMKLMMFLFMLKGRFHHRVSQDIETHLHLRCANQLLGVTEKQTKICGKLGILTICQRKIKFILRFLR